MTRRQSLSGPAALMVGSRLVSIALGLAMIPLMVHALGRGGFGAWTILLSCAAVWGELQIGMPAALRKHLSVALNDADEAETTRTASAVLLCLLGVYGVAAPLSLTVAPGLAVWLRVPETTAFSPGGLLALFLFAASARSVLQVGTLSLEAARRFHAVAALSTLQPLLSNACATATALLTRDLAWTSVAFWLAQIAVVGAAFARSRRELGWRFRPSLVDGRRIRVLIGFGLRAQVHEWAKVANFHLGKFVIVRVLGLAPAALYEVANRSALALKSVPSSGMDTFLPTAAIQAAQAVPSGDRLRRMATLSAYAAIAFFGIPLVVAPVFLYAWLGELGHAARWAFVLLGAAAAIELLAMPLGTLVQASGRPGIQARAGLVSVLVNVPVTVGLVWALGVEGAAIGSAIAAAAGFSMLVRGANRALGPDVATVVRQTAARFWPLVAGCVAWGAAVHISFARWYAASPGLRDDAGTRALAAFAALGLSVACLATLAGIKLLFVGIDEDEREVVRRVEAALTARGVGES